MARALRALERGATALGVHVARSVASRRRRTMAGPAPAIQRLPATVGEPAPDPPADRSDVDELQVRDLRAELTRELDRLADADIAASRGDGKRAGDASL